MLMTPSGPSIMTTCAALWPLFSFSAAAAARLVPLLDALSYYLY